MPKLPRIPAALALKALQRAHFYIYHQSGSHVQMRHRTSTEIRITIPSHKGDLAPKTLKTIINQAHLSVDEFMELL